jgi:hypothetical protein
MARLRTLFSTSYEGFFVVKQKIYAPTSHCGPVKALRHENMTGSRRQLDTTLLRRDDNTATHSLHDGLSRLYGNIKLIDDYDCNGQQGSLAGKISWLTLTGEMLLRINFNSIKFLRPQQHNDPVVCRPNNSSMCYCVPKGTAASANSRNTTKIRLFTG